MGGSGRGRRRSLWRARPPRRMSVVPCGVLRCLPVMRRGCPGQLCGWGATGACYHLGGFLEEKNGCIVDVLPQRPTRPVEDVWCVGVVYRASRRGLAVGGSQPCGCILSKWVFLAGGRSKPWERGRQEEYSTHLAHPHSTARTSPIRTVQNELEQEYKATKQCSSPMHSHRPCRR